MVFFQKLYRTHMIYIKNLNLLSVQNITNVQTANLVYKQKTKSATSTI